MKIINDKINEIYEIDFVVDDFHVLGSLAVLGGITKSCTVLTHSVITVCAHHLHISAAKPCSDITGTMTPIACSLAVT
jgi:hypothetical protein